jgi:hypothetical protein
LGIGDWAQSPIPNPQSPIPNPQSPYIIKIKFEMNIYLIIIINKNAQKNYINNKNKYFKF